jgi:hypothetical protein
VGALELRQAQDGRVYAAGSVELANFSEGRTGVDKYEKDLSIFGIVWILVVGILLYSFFSDHATADAHSAPLTGQLPGPGPAAIGSSMSPGV